MIKYTILSPTGTVLRTGVCPQDMLNLQAAQGETVIEGWPDVSPSPVVLNYTASRHIAYPSIGEQLDMLWHSMNNGEIPKSNAFFESIAAVKNQYPKE